MNNPTTMINGTTHQLYDALLGAFGRRAATSTDGTGGTNDITNSGASDGASDGAGPSDRGAVSLEQVLWYVAAGVSVAVIAAILWNQIRDEAETDIDVPVSP